MDDPISTDAATPSPAPESTTTQPPRRKRQLFKNRPAWSSQPTSTSTIAKTENAKDEHDDPLRAFSRAKDTFQLIQEAEERARQEKVKERDEAEKKEKEEKRKEIEQKSKIKERELAMYAKLSKNFEPARKKRRVSVEVVDNGEQEDGSGDESATMNEEGQVHKTGEENLLETGLATPPRSRSVRSTVTPRSSRKKQENGVIELLDREEKSIWTPSRRTRSTAVPDDNDEEHNVHQISPTLAIKSTQLFTIDDDDSDTPHSYQPTQTNRPTISRTPSTQQPATTSKSSAPPPPNPVLSLLIHSPFWNTTPLLVKRRLNQRLKEVRLAWINKQVNASPPPDSDFPSPDKIILTWRNKRCFDFTSCASLGLVIDELTGEVVVKRKDSDVGSGNVGLGASGMTVTEEREWRDAMADRGAQLVLEAVTEEIMTRRKNGVEEKPKDNTGARNQVGSATHTSTRAGSTQAQSMQEASQAHPQTQDQQEDTTTSAEEPKIKIILRAGKEYEDYKLQVRPSTTAAKITHAYRKRFAIPPDKNVFLTFEGDILADEDTIGDTDVGNMEVVEVRVR